MRTDRFAVSDNVQFIPVDEYGYGPVQWDHRREYGDGPYLVEEAEDVPGWYAHRVQHPQFVTINGEQYSGFWLQPAIAGDRRNG